MEKYELALALMESENSEKRNEAYRNLINL